jgi:hypothetical protein
LFTRWPQPHDADAAAESVTIRSAEAISIRPRFTGIIFKKPNPVRGSPVAPAQQCIGHLKGSGTHPVADKENDIFCFSSVADGLTAPGYGNARTK